MEKNIMLEMNVVLVRFVASILFALSQACSFLPAVAQQTGQRTFASTEDAGRAFFAATQAQDEEALLKILGPAGKAIVSSGDAIEDMDSRIEFVEKYQDMHRFASEPNGTVILIVGAENWPLPIPLVNNHGSWYFDTPSGRDEILFRRIGKNELSAMDACRDLVQAQKQYFAHTPVDLSKQFAQKMVSDEGQHNGLYWHGADDEFSSPLNPLIAYAYRKDSEDPVGEQVPFNGYFFRILTRQGPHAPGGTRNHVVDGKMTTGFAFVAYPAEYRSSGVMTFIANESGAVYEKDLGPNTTKLAEAMTSYDPDSTWHKPQ
jgi:hypothetical protein